MGGGGPGVVKFLGSWDHVNAPTHIPYIFVLRLENEIQMSWAFLLVSLNRFFFFIFSTLRCMEMTIVSTATNGPTKTRKIKKKINLFNTLKTVHTGERKKTKSLCGSEISRRDTAPFPIL